MKLLSTYEGYFIYIMPEYEDRSYTKKSKAKSSVWAHDDNDMLLFFI